MARLVGRRKLRPGTLVSQKQEYNDKKLLSNAMTVLNEREKKLCSKKII